MVKSSKTIANRNLLIIVGLFFILVTIKVVLSSGFYSPFIIPDETSYDKQAQHLLEGHLDPINPGYPAILSLAYVITNNKSIVYHIMLFISAIISSSIIFPAYFILRKYCPENISIMGALSVTTLTFINFLSFTIMTENLFTPLFLFSVWFLIESYGTNEIKWQILASLSVVYLYITRSNGVAMIVGFVIAFLYYMIVNRKNDTILRLITGKSALVASFIISLSAWLLISHMANPSISYGSTYDAVSISSDVSNSFFSLGNMLMSIKILLNEVAYLFICSFFFLTVAIFYYVVNRHKKPKTDPLNIAFVYTVSSIILLILAVVGFTFYTGEGLVVMGRYVEPVIPLIIILGIICINNMKNMSKKLLYSFIGFFIAILAITVFIMEIDLSIVFAFTQYVNNAGIYFLEPLYLIKFPEVLVSIYALAFLALMCLSIRNKAYINGLLILVILSSLIPSSSLYSIALDSSSFRKDNSINQYLDSYSNKTTLLYIDTNMTALEQKAGVNVYSYWNKGEVGYIRGDDKNITVMAQKVPVYLISVNQLPYREITNDDRFKLYQI